MTDAPDMAERHRAILTELSTLGAALARDLQGRALAASDADAAADLALAFHRISRSVRQTLALEARLERERRQVVREEARAVARETLARIQKKRAKVRDAATAEIWSEYEIEDDEAEGLLEDIGHAVMERSMEDGFLDAPIEVCIQRIRADLGLPAALAEGANDEPDAETSAPRQSSA